MCRRCGAQVGRWRRQRRLCTAGLRASRDGIQAVHMLLPLPAAAGSRRTCGRRSRAARQRWTPSQPARYALLSPDTHLLLLARPAGPPTLREALGGSQCLRTLSVRESAALDRKGRMPESNETSEWAAECLEHAEARSGGGGQVV